MDFLWDQIKTLTRDEVIENMKSERLAKLNFQTLLHYSDIPEHGARSSFPVRCTGYCMSCEQNGLSDSGDLRLDQMSHGSDTEDFERSICKLPPGGVELSVAFLLESPGAYYNNGVSIPYKGLKKQPPVNGYYWTPERATWPTDPSEIVNTYGDYFAYIIAKHKLHNAYFTNIIKCSLNRPEQKAFIPYRLSRSPDNRDCKILDNCFNLFLKEEMVVINPKVVFYFGHKAEKMGYYAGLSSLLPEAACIKLYHPAARGGFNRTLRVNDERIAQALVKISIGN